MLCNPVVWKVTLLLRYLKLQRITAVQFVYCFRGKKPSFLGALCYLRSQPHARWTSTLWLLCGTVRIPVSSSCLVVPLTAPLLIIPFFLLLSMGQSFAGSRWIGSSPASLRSSTNSSCISTASPTWRWWLVTPTFTATCSRSTTTTTSSRRCQPLTRSSGSSYRDKVSWSTLCDFLRLFIPRRLRL